MLRGMLLRRFCISGNKRLKDSLMALHGFFHPADRPPRERAERRRPIKQLLYELYRNFIGTAFKQNRVEARVFRCKADCIAGIDAHIHPLQTAA